VDIVIRQAHPGGREPPYRHFAQKLTDARSYQLLEDIPWPVLVDDLEGTVHQEWGGLSDPSFLVDAEGRVAFYCVWTAARPLREAIRELLAHGGTGPLRKSIHRRPEMGPVLADGWRAIERGLPQSATDLMVAIPFSPMVLWLSYRGRTAPRRRLARSLAVAAAAGLALGVGWYLSRR
jgi:hypothetical protein